MCNTSKIRTTTWEEARFHPSFINYFLFFVTETYYPQLNRWRSHCISISINLCLKKYIIHSILLAKLLGWMSRGKLKKSSKITVLLEDALTGHWHHPVEALKNYNNSEMYATKIICVYLLKKILAMDAFWQQIITY